MALLVAYTDSEESSDDNDENQLIPETKDINDNPKKRKFSEINSDEDNDDINNKQEPLNKKRKKIKPLPSAKNALKSNNKISKINEMDENKQKQRKIDMLLIHKNTHNKAQKHKNMKNSNNEDKYNNELKQNQIENAKYVQKQLKILHEAEKEAKFKKSIQETTRQKNARKQKYGQANFTLKWDRDCGHEMAGI